MAKSKVAKGSWTVEEITRALYEWPTDTPITDPLTEKVERGLIALIPVDVYPFALSLMSTSDGFISKRLALALINWLLLDKESWQADADKVLSLRRMRVGRLVDAIKVFQPVLPTDDMTSAAIIMRKVADWNFWNLGKSDFSLATTYLAQASEMPLFHVLDALTVMTRNGFDTAAALQSVIIWRNHISPELVIKQLELL